MMSSKFSIAKRNASVSLRSNLKMNKIRFGKCKLPNILELDSNSNGSNCSFDNKSGCSAISGQSAGKESS
jgi:hypothetical protein